MFPLPAALALPCRAVAVKDSGFLPIFFSGFRVVWEMAVLSFSPEGKKFKSQAVCFFEETGVFSTLVFTYCLDRLAKIQGFFTRRPRLSSNLFSELDKL